MIQLILTISFTALAHAGSSTTCVNSHAKAVSSCAAHEHSLSAASLTIVSRQTRARVVKSEEARLVSLKNQCLKTQETCALTCDEEVETASLGGEDLTLPLDKLTDCRQGQVALHLRAMDKKLAQLRRVLTHRPVGQPIKNASNP